MIRDSEMTMRISSTIILQLSAMAKRPDLPVEGLTPSKKVKQPSLSSYRGMLERDPQCLCHLYDGPTCSCYGSIAEEEDPIISSSSKSSVKVEEKKELCHVTSSMISISPGIMKEEPGVKKEEEEKETCNVSSSLNTPSPPLFVSADALLEERLFISVECRNKEDKCQCLILSKGFVFTPTSIFKKPIEYEYRHHIPYASSGYSNPSLDHDIYTSCTLHNKITCTEWQMGIYLPMLGHITVMHIEYSDDIAPFIKSFDSVCEKLFKHRAKDVPFCCMLIGSDLYLSRQAYLFIERCVDTFHSDWGKFNKNLGNMERKLYFRTKLMYSEESAGKVWTFRKYGSTQCSTCSCEKNGHTLPVKEENMPIFPNIELGLYKCYQPVRSHLLYVPPWAW